MAILENKHLRLIGALSGKPGGWYISPHGFNLYRVASGDSLASIAARFLGSADRAAEIWTIQSAPWRASRRDDPNNLAAGDELLMPQEAVDNAKGAGLASGGSGEAPSKFSGPMKTLAGGTDVLVPHGGGNVLPFVPTPRPAPATPPSAPSSPATLPTTSSKIPLTKILVLGGLGTAAAIAALAIAAHGAHATRHNPRRGTRRRGLARRLHAADDGA